MLGAVRRGRVLFHDSGLRGPARAVIRYIVNKNVGQHANQTTKGGKTG